MISYLKGTLKGISTNSFTLLVGNIGFNINYPIAYLFEQLNSEIEVYTYMNVKEDDLSLWGLRSQAELELLKMLVAISGVGPRTAQNIIVTKGVEMIVDSILLQEYKSLKVSGVGDKIAQKIVIELKDKIEVFSKSFQLEFKGKERTKKKVDVNSDKINEILDAVISLGYRKEDSEVLVQDIVADNKDISIGDAIKLFLKTI